MSAFDISPTLNLTQEENAEIEEMRTLQSLLNGYNSILYRYNEESVEGRKVNKWSYDFQTNQGRPDRQRSKYTSDEAIKQLHKVDQIFPLYDKYFNYAKMKNSSSVTEIICERVKNIEGKLAEFEAKYGSSANRMLNGRKENAIHLAFVILVLLFKCYS